MEVNQAMAKLLDMAEKKADLPANLDMALHSSLLLMAMFNDAFGVRALAESLQGNTVVDPSIRRLAVACCFGFMLGFPCHDIHHEYGEYSDNFNAYCEYEYEPMWEVPSQTAMKYLDNNVIQPDGLQGLFRGIVLAGASDYAIDVLRSLRDKPFYKHSLLLDAVQVVTVNRFYDLMPLIDLMPCDHLPYNSFRLPKGHKAKLCDFILHHVVNLLPEITHEDFEWMVDCGMDVNAHVGLRNQRIRLAYAAGEFEAIDAAGYSFLKRDLAGQDTLSVLPIALYGLAPYTGSDGVDKLLNQLAREFRNGRVSREKMRELLESYQLLLKDQEEELEEEEYIKSVEARLQALLVEF